MANGGQKITRVPALSFIVVVGLIAILAMAIFGPFVIMGLNALKKAIGIPVTAV